MTNSVCSDMYSLECQAQALACLLMLERCAAPACLQAFDTTPELVAEFSELAFDGCCPQALHNLYNRYVHLTGKPTYQPAVFDAILAFCQANEKRLEAASGPLGWDRLKQERRSPGHGSLYRKQTLERLLGAAEELSA